MARKAARKSIAPAKFNIVIVGQKGRLQYEALLFAASLRHASPGFQGRLFVAEPQPGPLWNHDPRMSNEIVEELRDMDAEILPFASDIFGQAYPHGNKIEALRAMPPGESFVFFDSDTLVLDELALVPFDFSVPSASRRVDNTWPEIELYGPGYTATWKSLYDKFDLDFESSLDTSWPDEFWRRYLYFNAGYFYYACPKIFGTRFAEYARAIRDDPPPELVCQSLDPWLDQVALPLVVHSLGGRRDALPDGMLDGMVTCHWRVLSLLYARESDRVVDTLETIAAPNRIKKLLKEYEPMKRMIYQRRGHKVRAMFDRENLPRKERALRNQIKKANFWMR